MSVTSKIHIYIIREMTGKSHTGGVIFLISFYPPVRIVRIDGVLLLLSSLYSANLPVVDRVENLPVIKQHEIFICWLKEFNYFMHISVINDWQSLDKYSELWNCLHQKKKIFHIFPSYPRCDSVNWLSWRKAPLTGMFFCIFCFVF